MKNPKKINKTLFAVLAILMLAAASLVAIIPFANAATQQIETYSFIAAAPDPIGVGQTLLVTFRLDKVSPTATAYGGDRFGGFSVTITKPDGTTETRGSLTTDSTSNGWFTYVPSTPGTYRLQAHFPGQRITGMGGGFGAPPTPIDNTYLPSNSATININVTQAQVLQEPNNPLPSGYWTTPIYGENKGWNAVADNWLMQGYDYLTRSFGSGNAVVAPYTAAPDSAHIIWTKPIMLGGIVGGSFGDKTFYQGLSYEEHYNPLILDGKIIFTEHYLDQGTVYQTRCVDLYTGEDVWTLNNTDILLAQVVEIDTPNEHGALAYLWSVSGGASFFGPALPTTLTMYDAFTARKMCSITNVTGWSSGGFGGKTVVPGPKGEILAYSLDAVNNKLTLWNSTKVLYTLGFIDTWGPTLNNVYDGNAGIEWSVSIPDIPGAQSLQIVRDGYALAQYTDSSVVPNIYEQVVYDVASMTKDASGNYPTTLNHLWVQNRTNIHETFFIQGPIGSGITIMYDESKLQFHGYSIRTGTELWVTEAYTNGWASFNWQWEIAYGLLYVAGYDGHVRAYNTATGALAWDFYFGSAGFETPYGEFPVYSGFNIADGKVYITNDEHSPDAVPWRGGKLWCIDAFSGQGLWNVSGKLRMGAISNGYYTTLNSLDGQIYTFGKGPSEITVLAPQIAVPLGTSVVITGSVTDQSPGAEGTPAISDADMSAWMEYMYEQQAMPTSAKGVPVLLTAVYPDGTTNQIGTTTSDIGGSFGLSWKPTMEGTYQITAIFEGTNSYGNSYATTYMIVGPAHEAVSTATPTPTVAPTETPTTTPTPTPVAEPDGGIPTETLLIAGAAVIIVVAVVAAALVLRKRK